MQPSAATICYWAGKTWKAIRDRARLITDFVVAALLTLVFLMLAMPVSYGLALADYIRDSFRNGRTDSGTG
jgi:hypothetical protein